MNLQAIPEELKALRQWVIWRAVTNEQGRVTKPPFQARQPQYQASVDRPETWATFEECVAVMRAHPDLAHGLGFVFTRNDPYFGIDIDSEGKVSPAVLETRREFVSAMLEGPLTYTERSPSGEGYHIIGRGRLPEAGKRVTSLQVEVYGEDRYFTFTGIVYNGRNEITDQQPFLDWVYSNLVAAGRQTLSTTENSSERPQGLSDEQVLRLCAEYHPTFWVRYTAQQGCDPGEWSDTFMAIVGIIDRFTGDVEQVQRLVMTSPMVTHAQPSAAGETREAKARRTLPSTLTRVRQGNNGQLHFINHGRAMYENIVRTREQRALEAAERLRNAEEAIRGKQILDAFPMLAEHHKTLTRPPGWVGEYVKATEGAMFHPFTKYAIPATLAALAGIIARGYKLPSGTGLNLNFILAAPTSTGKTQTMAAWNRFMTEASNAIGNTLAGQSKSRILMQGTSSIQGIFEDFMAMPSLCWSIEECAAQLKSMSEGTSPTEVQLRDAFNTLFDVSEHGSLFSPPRSVANRRANIAPINNLCVSTFWTTTDSKFDAFGTDALDGFLSRVTVIRHTGSAGTRVRDSDVQRYLPALLRDRLIQLLTSAKQLDETYAMNANAAVALLVPVSTQQVSALIEDVQDIIERIKDAALNRELPPAYTAVARLPLVAQRIAGVLAVVDNPYQPTITNEHFLWSFGYALQSMLTLLADMDKGELGTDASDATMAVVRVLTRLSRKPEYKGLPGVPRQVLRDNLKHVKPFNLYTPQNIRGGRSKQVSETFELMIKEGMLSEIELPAQTSGRPVKLLCPTDDSVWSND